MQPTKSVDLIGHSEFLPWQQLNGCSRIRFFLSAKGVACESSLTKEYSSNLRNPGSPVSTISLAAQNSVFSILQVVESWLGNEAKYLVSPPQD